SICSCDYRPSVVWRSSSPPTIRSSPSAPIGPIVSSRDALGRSDRGSEPPVSLFFGQEFRRVSAAGEKKRGNPSGRRLYGVRLTSRRRKRNRHLRLTERGGGTPVFERFTERARRVIILAREEAGRFRHDFVGTEHVLLGLIRDGEGIATAVLQRLGLRLETVKAEVERALAGFPKTLTFGEVPFTPQAKRVLELSIEEARQLGHNYIGTEHLLLGLMKEGQSIAAKILESLGARLDEVRQETLALLGDQYYPR